MNLIYVTVRLLLDEPGRGGVKDLVSGNETQQPTIMQTKETLLDVIFVNFWCSPSQESQKAFILILSPQIRKSSLRTDKRCLSLFMIPVWFTQSLFVTVSDCDSITPRQCDRSCLGFKVSSHNDRSALSDELLCWWADISVPCLSWPGPVFFFNSRL